MRNNLFISTSLNSIVSFDSDAFTNKPFYSTVYSDRKAYTDNDRLAGSYDITKRLWSSSSPSLAGGKVRQLFKERRATQGLDRSQPLDPIKKSKKSSGNHNKSADHILSYQKNELKNSYSIQSHPLYDPQERFISDYPDTVYSDDGMDIRKSNIPYRVSGSIPVKKTFKSPTSDTKSTINTGELKKTLSPSHAQVRTTSKVSSINTEIKRTPNRVSSVTNSFSKLSTSDSVSKTSTSIKPAPRSTLIKTQPVKRIETKPVNKTPPVRTSGPVDPNLVTCSICGRHFNQERIALHQTICKKTAVKKRRPFDPVKHRLQGTEAEDYLKKPKRASATNTNTKDKKSNWRKKHEEFIAIVRSAREAQAYVAKGGKLSDLPPPPSMSTEDLVQCPHCGRKFNEGAAERHIPKCANIRSNKATGPSKTKPAPGRR